MRRVAALAAGEGGSLKRGTFHFFACVLAACGAVGGPQAPDRSAPTANQTICGAAGAALMPFAQAAAKALPAEVPGLSLSIEEARSSAAIKKVIDAELELAFTSRPVRPAESESALKLGRSLHMVVVAAEAVAVVVHADNPLRNITLAQLRGVFFDGTIRDWGDLTNGEKTGPIHVLAVNPRTSGTGELFVSAVAGDANAAYVADATIVDFSDATAERVSADGDAISFSGMGSLNGQVSSLAIDGVRATEKTILDTSYIFNRKLFVVTAGPPRGGSRELVKFLLSGQGQLLARAQGVTPIALE
jgi:phosphate transport system substrate-binding protein